MIGVLLTLNLIQKLNIYIYNNRKINWKVGLAKHLGIVSPFGKKTKGKSTVNHSDF